MKNSRGTKKRRAKKKKAQHPYYHAEWVAVAKRIWSAVKGKIVDQTGNSNLTYEEISNYFGKKISQDSVKQGFASGILSSPHLMMIVHDCLHWNGLPEILTHRRTFDNPAFKDCVLDAMCSHKEWNIGDYAIEHQGSNPKKERPTTSELAELRQLDEELAESLNPRTDDEFMRIARKLAKGDEEEANRKFQLQKQWGYSFKAIMVEVFGLGAM
jgi:hypothetical protein